MNLPVNTKMSWFGIRPAVTSFCIIAISAIIAGSPGVGLVLGAEDQGNLPTLSLAELGYSVEHWTMENGLPGRAAT